MTVTTLRVWRVRPAAVPSAFLAMAVDRGRLRRTPGVRFAKLLGTGAGSGFGPGSADLTRWASLVVSDGPAPRIPAGRIEAECVITLGPIASRGSWSGAEPFDAGPRRPRTTPDDEGAEPFDAGPRRPRTTPDDEGAEPSDAGARRPSTTPDEGVQPSDAGPRRAGAAPADEGGRPFDAGTRRPGAAGTTEEVDAGTSSTTEKNVLVLTRARIRAAKAVKFWRAIGPVAQTLGQQEGLLAAFGIGEAPIGFQGTVSIWRDATDVRRFAYRQPEHAAVVEGTPRHKWYAEELFARFTVLDIAGDREVIGWTDGK